MAVPGLYISWDDRMEKVLVWNEKPNPMHCRQGIEIKGKEMALVWHEKASRTALQTSSANLRVTLLV